MNRAEILEWAGTRISPTEQRHILLAIAARCDLVSHQARLTRSQLGNLAGLRGYLLTDATYALWSRYLIDMHAGPGSHGVITYRLRIEGDTAP